MPGGSPPSPPDPYETAGAQAQANTQAAIASAFMNNINEKTPFGSSQYNTTGSYTTTGPDGAKIKVPIREKIVTLSPAEQAKLNASNKLQIGMLGLGNSQLGRVGDALAKPLNFNGAVDRVTKIGNGPALENRMNLRDPRSNIGDAGRVDMNVSRPDRLASGYGSGGTIDSKVGPQQELQTQFDRFDSSVGSVSRGRPTYEESYAPAGGFSADRARVSAGIMSRVNPALEKQRQALESRLTAQGLTRGTAAFNNELNEFRQQNNDALVQADLAGGQEQSRLLGEARSAAGFTNEARARGFQDRAQAFGQDFAQELAGYNANMTRQQASNDARLASTNRDLAVMSGENAAQAQRNQQNLQAASFGNAASIARTDRELAIMAGENAAQQQRFGQQAGRAAFTNASRDMSNQNRLTEAGFRNNALQQTFENRANAAGFQNDQRAAQIEEMMALRNAPINEVSAFLGGAQVNTPQFQSMYRPNIDPAPVGDYVYQSYNAEANAAAQQNQGLFGLASAGLGGLFSAFSDARLKTDVVRIGATPGGLPLYRFRYIFGGPEQVGVMAQEVLGVAPDAVSVVDGFLAVDYSKIV